MEQQVCVHRLFERRLEALDQVVGQFPYESYRIDQQKILIFSAFESPDRRIQGGEKLILHEHVRIAQSVDQR